MVDTHQGLRHFQVKIKPMLDVSEKYRATVIILNDITERKQVEEALRQSERFLSAVFDSIQDGISVLDSELNITRVNHAMRKLYADMLPLEGKKCYQAYHGRVNPCEICPTLRALQTGKLEVNEVPLTQENHVHGTLELFAFPMIDDSGKPTGVVEYVRDITARKKTEEAFREREKLKGVLEMSGAVCHEVNQPLMAILGYAELIKMSVSKDDPLSERVGKIIQQIDKLAIITQKLQSIARYETKKYLDSNIIDIDRSAPLDTVL